MQLINKHFRETGILLRETGNGRTIEGYAILFNSPSDPLMISDNEIIREVITPSAVTKSLLDRCDIKMTMFHDRQMILARSRNGKGTLKYSVDSTGVKFTFEAPKTIDGDKAIELVKRGDLAGCSFAFSTYYDDPKYVQLESRKKNGKTEITYRVKRILAIYDFTLASDPAYQDTSVEARTLSADSLKVFNQARELRKSATKSYFL